MGSVLKLSHRFCRGEIWLKWPRRGQPLSTETGHSRQVSRRRNAPPATRKACHRMVAQGQGCRSGSVGTRPDQLRRDWDEGQGMGWLLQVSSLQEPGISEPRKGTQVSHFNWCLLHDEEPKCREAKQWGPAAQRTKVYFLSFFTLRGRAEEVLENRVAPRPSLPAVSHRAAQRRRSGERCAAPEASAPR